MADRQDTVSAWDGKFIHFATRDAAEAGVRAGTLQYWDEHNEWTPGWQMKFPNQFPFVAVTAPAPAADSIDPQSGPPGSQFKVTGTNFNETSVVKLQTKALATDFISPTEVIAYVPTNTSLGLKSVIVQNETGAPTAQLAFEVIAAAP
jgi:hypothetical protein